VKKSLLLALIGLLLWPGPAPAITIDPFYAGTYTFTDLGSVPGLPPFYGGLTLKDGDPNTLLIGGNANAAPGALYSIGVVRDAGNHIIGFSGSASFFADAAFNDGGVVYGPGGVLFLARWPVNELGQTKPGSAITDRIIDLDPLGVVPSPGGLAFVPVGFPGAGQLKLVSWAVVHPGHFAGRSGHVQRGLGDPGGDDRGRPGGDLLRPARLPALR